ncbi:hypothetical protein I7331_28940 [Frankia sp. AgB1.8]|nr:hypothetical protein [Frankia sp. AgB1.8]
MLRAQGRVTALADAAEPGVVLSRGARLVAGDDEGSYAQARVIRRRRRWGGPPLVILAVDLATFESV